MEPRPGATPAAANPAKTRVRFDFGPYSPLQYEQSFPLKPATTKGAPRVWICISRLETKSSIRTTG
jgi:hypothetical protein